MAGVALEIVIADSEVTSSKEYKNKNITGSLPLLETDEEGNPTIAESLAICKYLVQVGPNGAGLLGNTPMERVKVEQWLSFAFSQVRPNVQIVADTLFGLTKPYSDEFNDASKALKEQLRLLNGKLANNPGSWVVGDECTLADIYLAGTVAPAYQTCLDAGFQKGMPAVTGWFTRMTRLPPFVAAFGFVKTCAKPIKPPKLPQKEKPKAPEKKPEAAAAAAKPKPAAPEEQKKAGNPLDALPPTNFVIYDFKTLFVNLPDKLEDGHEKMMSLVDKDGWSFWFLHYDKYGEEGKVAYKF